MVAGQLHVTNAQRGLINRRMMEPSVRQGNYAEVELGFRQAAEGRRAFEPLPKKVARRAWKAQKRSPNSCA